MEVSERIRRLETECVTLRRQLHRFPETAYQENRTQAFVLEYLAGINPDRLEPIAGTGVRAVFFTPGATQTIAFRADMDGLPVTEETGLAFASECPGRMHACGHDGHTAALLCFAKFLSGQRSRLSHNVVLLFQPAEEGAAGAEKMVQAGALKNPPVDRIYGFHIWPSLALGRIGFRLGPLMAQSCGLDIVIKSRPEAQRGKTVDAIMTASELITILQTLVSRMINPEEPVVFTIGRIAGGKARNVICTEVMLNCTLRSFSDETFHNVIYPRITNMINGFSMASGATIDITMPQLYHCVNNPSALFQDLAALLGPDADTDIPRAMNSEDFSFYQKEVPGLYFFVGIRDREDFPPLHNSRFDFDEKALLYGLEVYSRILGLSKV